MLKVCFTGTVGEIFITGPHVALGYVGDASSQDTASILGFTYLRSGLPSMHESLCFLGEGVAGVCSPQEDPRALRAYSTGDLGVVHRVAGSDQCELFYVGRADHQVKV